MTDLVNAYWYNVRIHHMNRILRHREKSCVICQCARRYLKSWINIYENKDRCSDIQSNEIKSSASESIWISLQMKWQHKRIEWLIKSTSIFRANLKENYLHSPPAPSPGPKPTLKNPTRAQSITRIKIGRLNQEQKSQSSSRRKTGAEQKSRTRSPDPKFQTRIPTNKIPSAGAFVLSCTLKARKQ